MIREPTSLRLVGKILRWGNSYGIRLGKADVEEHGLHEGEEIAVEIGARPGQRIDVADLPSWNLGGNLPERHDQMLYGDA